MRLFAQLDENNIVIGVIGNIIQPEGNYIETFLDGSVHKNYAGLGYLYDEGRDAFIEPKPFNSWLLNESTCQYEAPIPKPTPGQYHWDEESLSWIEIT